MNLKECLAELNATEKFFNNSTSCFDEENSTYSPVEGTFTVAQQIAHVAQTIDWFLEGMFNANGFSLDFEAHLKEVSDISSLKAAQEWLARSFKQVKEIIEKKSQEELDAPLADGPIMGKQPRYHVIGSIADHTAHHRGALTVYARLLGKEPKMPYLD